MSYRGFKAVALTALLLAGTVACNGSDSTSTAHTPGATDTRSAGTPVATKQAVGSPASVAPTSAAAAPTAKPTADATEQASVQQFGDLAPLVLQDTDVPFGFRLRSSQPVRKDDIITAELGILTLAAYVRTSDLAGAWAKLYTREQPTAGLSSIVYRFGSPGGATGFVSATAALNAQDYPAAVSIDPVDAAKIGDVSQFMRYRIPGGRTLEYTWSHGALLGQVILRYSGDIESPDDVALVISLAQKVDDKMKAAAP
jgi:hypothetical protein